MVSKILTLYILECQALQGKVLIYFSSYSIQGIR